MMTSEELARAIEQREIKNADLSGVDVSGLDFSGCHLENVTFCNQENEAKVIKNIDFKKATFYNVFFDYADIRNCDFDGKETTIEKVSFKKCMLYKCRFRKTQINWTDFRYAEIHFGTFEEALVSNSDFYRTFFIGIIIFRKSFFQDCSLYYSYFDEGAVIRKDNLYKGRLLQQKKRQYEQFLRDWQEHGPGIRKNEQEKLSEWDYKNSLKARYNDAEEIYKTLNGLWLSKGFLGDSNWAYVKGKRMERNRMLLELFSQEKTGFFKRISLSFQILFNLFKDVFFGYGESMRKMILTYILMVFVFAYIYFSTSEINLGDYFMALMISLKNMVAMTPGEVQGISPFLDFMNMIQTTIGILITGIFGFVLGNKIRNQ